MEIKKVAASVFAALLFGGVMETANAAEAPKLRIAKGIEFDGDVPKYKADYPNPAQRGKPVFDADKEDEAEAQQFFIALRKKGLDVTQQRNISAAGRKGLRKYMLTLVPLLQKYDITLDKIPNEDKDILRGKLSLLAKKADEILRAQDANKAEKVRQAVMEATNCILAFNNLHDIIKNNVENAKPDELRDRFIAEADRIGTSIGTLSSYINDNFKNPDGQSRKALTELKNAVDSLKRSLMELVVETMRIITKERDENASFDFLYLVLQIIGSYGDDPMSTLSGHKDLDPATDKNGNKDIEQRFKDWVNNNKAGKYPEQFNVEE